MDATAVQIYSTFALSVVAVVAIVASRNSTDIAKIISVLASFFRGLMK